MGSPKDEKDREINDKSEEQVKVTFTRGFWLGRYETTQWQWAKVMGTTLREQIKKVNDQLYVDYMNSMTGVPRALGRNFRATGRAKGRVIPCIT